MKKTALALILLPVSLLTHAMANDVADYLNEYPKASQATLVLDYLFIEDDKGNILDQCFIRKDKTKKCSLNINRESKASDAILPALDINRAYTEREEVLPAFKF